MESPGPPYRGQSLVSGDIYANRNYANPILSPSGVSTNYMTYHSESSHPSNYTEQSHYSTSSPSSQSYTSSNSGQSYGQSVHRPVNQFPEMYDTCSPYAANIGPATRHPIASSNLKYWNSDNSHQMSHNYNQAISPPPLMSRNHSLRSSPLTTNNYNGTPVGHRPSSRSPQDWPNASPSSLPHSVVNRSPSQVSSQQFSPSHPSHTSRPSSEGSQSAPKGQSGIAFDDQNHNTSHTSASNPLQSLQKMVTPMNSLNNSDNGPIEAEYNNGSVELISSPNSIHKNYNTGHSGDPESPYPTYYNLDQNRLCTPPHSTANPTPNDIPTKGKEPSIDTNDNELKCETNESNDTNSDLIYSNLDDSKPELPLTDTTIKTTNKTTTNTINANDTPVGINGALPHKPAKVSLTNNSDVSSDLSQEVIAEHISATTTPVVTKTTESRDSMQSSDSETYNDSRVQSVWQMDKEYYNRYPDQKNSWSQWPQNNVSGGLVSTNNYMGPAINPIPYQTYRPNQCGAGSWTPPVSSTHTTNPNQAFTPPKSMGAEPGKKKRGRPFGSKNRRNSDDNNSEKNPSSASSHSKKSKKAVTEEIGINTSVSIDAHGFDQLAVVNPLKQTVKRKKAVGPVIRMEKTKGGLTTKYEIVNTSSKPEDEKDVKTKAQSTKTESLKHHIRRPSLLVSSKKAVSNFSSNNDANAADKTWVCALCHNGPHYKGLGDLFGPYLVALDDKSKPQISGSSSTTTPNASNIRSHTSILESIDKTIDSVISCEPKPAKRGRKRKSENSESRPKLEKSDNETESNPQSNATQVWIHEDCIVWSNNVYLIGHRIKNLEEVIIESTENVCTKCKLTGATLGCLQKSCNTSQYHYLCAKERGCEMDEDNFSLHCPKHKKKAKGNSTQMSEPSTGCPKS